MNALLLHVITKILKKKIVDKNNFKKRCLFNQRYI